MAELSPNSNNRKSAPARSRKKSTKIDMTAMVDVAFLLLTFFVLTATLTDQSMMEVVMPPKSTDGIDAYESLIEDRIMTLLIQSDDRIGYYVGLSQATYHETDFSTRGLRSVLRAHLTPDEGQTRCETGTGARRVRGCWDPIFVVKAHKGSRYRSLVDVLDELAIVGAPKYAMDQYSETDSLITTGIFDYYSEAGS